MSATLDDIHIDLDAIDAEAAAEKAKKDPPKGEPIEVIKADESPKAADKQVLKPEDGLAKLQQQLAEERSARESAESRLRESAEAEVRARTENQDNQLHLVTTAIEKFEQQNEVLKGNYAQALADQDFKAAAEIQMSMSENAANLVNLKQGAEALKKAPKPQMRVQPDIVDMFVQNMTPQSAAWVRSHPEFVRDPRKNAKMIAAHNFIKDDVKVDSDEYFSRIEEMLGLQKIPDKTDEVDPMADAAKPVRKAAPAAAPVTRSGNGAGKRPNQVTLTADERQAARDSDMTDEEYARNKIALQREGRLN